MKKEKKTQPAGYHKMPPEATDTNDHRLEAIFGEALGDTASADETQEAWQAFARKQTEARVRRRTAVRRRIYWAASVAAAIALLAVIWPDRTVPTQTVEVFTSLQVPKETTVREKGERVIVTTPPATTTTLRLSDGTQVLLSANSRLEYPKHFTDTLRLVSLTGEARFDVAEDPSRPFIVSTELLQTRVLGTLFDVQAYPQSRPNVTLYEGRVHVNSTGRKQSRDMKPGEQVTLDRKGKMQLQKIADGQKGWADGEFSFDNQELEEVMKEIGTWYNINVIFHSRPLLQERIYFRICRHPSADKVLDALNDLGIARFEIKDGKILVAPLSSSKNGD